MSWGSDNTTASRTHGGLVQANTLSSGPTGYFGYGVSVGGHNAVTVTGTNTQAANFGGEFSGFCFADLIPKSQALIIGL